MKQYLIIFSILLGPGLKAEIAHISPEKARQLKADFESSRPIGELDSLLGSSWSCTLFGVSTRLQQSKGLNLFKFIKLKNDSLVNQGSHLFENYHIDQGRFISIHRSKSLIEELRRSSSGSVTSRISQLDVAGKDVAGKSDQVLAYSTCFSRLPINL